MPSALVDTHCHIDLYPSPAAVAALAEEQSIDTIAVTNAPSVYFFTAKLAEGKRHIRAALGLHPELVATHGHEIENFLSLLDQTRYVGEVGLDYTTRDEDNRRRQRDVLKRILTACAASREKKILTLHSRRSAGDVIDLIGGGFPGTIILHWFSGSQRDLLRGLEFGFYFSVNPAMALSDAGRKLVALIPPDRILTETDGPFVKCGQAPAQPPDVRTVVSQLAAMWHRSVDEVASKVAENLQRAVQTF